MAFRHYKKSDYEAVCGFLTALNRDDRRHMHWNWARFEWMYAHPEFDKTAEDAIGLWFDGGRVVGMLSLGDLARNEYYAMEATEAFSEISSNVLRK